jgi:hypothetical protein
MPPNLGKPYLSPKRTSVGTHGWLNGPIHVTVPRSSNHAIWTSITLPSSLAVHTNKPQPGATPVTRASVIKAPALLKCPGRAALAGEGHNHRRAIFSHYLEKLTPFGPLASSWSTIENNLRHHLCRMGPATCFPLSIFKLVVPVST